MTHFQPALQEEDSRSFEGKAEVDEEEFFNFREDEVSSSSPRPTWSTFEDLDDSGQFTASPDGERTFSGSSRSHSPCQPSAHLLLQMQHQDNQFSSQFQHPLHLAKPLISPRSIMTVKVPQANSSALSFLSNDVCNRSLLNSNEDRTKNSNLAENCSISETNRNQKLFLSSTDSFADRLPAGDMLMPQACSSVNPTIGSEKITEESSDYLRSILENFNSLYMEKLRMIDDLVTEGSEEQKRLLMERKTNMLENWAKDVCVQNMVLVHTVEELEREANRKVSALQSKITESTQLAKEHMTMIKKYEQQVKILLKNHSDTEEENLVLKIDLEKLKSECRRVRDRMNLLLRDNESLITLVCRIRDMGVWDVSGLEIQRSSFDQIFGLYPNLVGSEVQTVFTREKAKHAKDTEEKVTDLEQQLEDFHRTRKEFEATILQKDRKIEELETEITNLSHKAKYCEQECNGYKKSFLETQEKLLEATRKLNSTPKISRPSTPAVNEMTELIRELRDVKFELNTAVEEKQTARNESSFFKKELSQRLKEMQDIQNVFQSLATEVVSSRSAFQQVQEKEVQLQSLKSEIQTYQSRCTDAEDTIRKKEAEIKQLQQNMNKIHNKSKKLSYISSSSLDGTGTVNTSEKPNSTMLSFYRSNLRNASNSSKIPVRKSNALSKRNEDMKITSENGSSNAGKRPPWNTHFIKSTGLISTPAAALPTVSKSSLSKQSEATTRQFSVVNEKIIGCTNRKNKFADRQREKQLSSDQASYSNKMSENAHSSPSAIKCRTKPQRSVTLPQIQSSKIGFKRQARNASGLNGEKLPVVKDKSKPVPLLSLTSKNPPTKFDNPVLKQLVDNPVTHTPRINELIKAVVETSKQLLGSGDGETEPSKPLKNGFTITAAHYRSQHCKSHVKQHFNKRTKPDKKTKTEERHKQRDASKSSKRSRKLKSPHVVTQQSVKQTGAHFEQPQDVQKFLLGLPQESQEDIVKGWIEKSSTQQTVNLRKSINPWMAIQHFFAVNEN